MLATALEKIADMCFASAFETYFEALLFMILAQNKGSALSKFTIMNLPLLRQLLEACSFNLVECFSPSLRSVGGQSQWGSGLCDAREAKIRTECARNGWN